MLSQVLRVHFGVNFCVAFSLFWFWSLGCVLEFVWLKPPIVELPHSRVIHPISFFSGFYSVSSMHCSDAFPRPSLATDETVERMEGRTTNRRWWERRRERRLRNRRTAGDGWRWERPRIKEKGLKYPSLGWEKWSGAKERLGMTYWDQTQLSNNEPPKAEKNDLPCTIHKVFVIVTLAVYFGPRWASIKIDWTTFSRWFPEDFSTLQCSGPYGEDIVTVFMTTISVPFHSVWL